MIINIPPLIALNQHVHETINDNNKIKCRAECESMNLCFQYKQALNQNKKMHA